MANEVVQHQSQAPAKTGQPADVKTLMQSEKFKQSVAAALPKHLTPDRFVRVALNATMKNPELLQCTQDSFFRCLLELSAYGIEPDGRRAHLIPRNVNVAKPGEAKKWQKQCTVIIDYKGLAELVRRSGDVSYIHADVVYKGDEWSFAYGSNAHLRHVPQERGAERAVAAYSFVKLKDGTEDFIVMFPSEIDKIRKRSKNSDSGPWQDDWGEMAKKTVFRRHSKWLPLSPDVRDAVENDQDAVDVESTLDGPQFNDTDAASAGTQGKLDEVKESLRTAEPEQQVIQEVTSQSNQTAYDKAREELSAKSAASAQAADQQQAAAGPKPTTPSPMDAVKQQLKSEAVPAQETKTVKKDLF